QRSSLLQAHSRFFCPVFNLCSVRGARVVFSGNRVVSYFTNVNIRHPACWAGFARRHLGGYDVVFTGQEDDFREYKDSLQLIDAEKRLAVQVNSNSSPCEKIECVDGLLSKLSLDGCG